MKRVNKKEPNGVSSVINNEKGVILLTVLILLFIGTLIGVIALNNSTVEIQIAAYENKVSTLFATTEAGLDLAVPIIEETLDRGALTPSSMTIGGHTVTPASNLLGEILNVANVYDTDTAAGSPDISIPTLEGSEIKIDIDRLYTEVIPGGALEMAAGYEGEGKGAAGGGMAIYYRIHSRGTK